MQRLERASVLLELTRAHRKLGSWCGETHIQKATYFLQELLKVPLGCQFILYKYGPFSFGLRDELAGMQADRILMLELMPYPYGPSFVEGPSGELLRTQYPEPARTCAGQIGFVVEKLASKKVTELEKLATALWVTLEGKAREEDRATRMSQLKPHVALAEAQAALAEVDAIRQQAQALGKPCLAAKA